jgi:TP901 family phage tail tape measure protein
VANVNANIHIGINATQALGQLRALQSQISKFNQSIVAGNAAAAATQASMTASMASMIGATGKFSTSIRTMETGVSALGTAFDKGTLSSKQYFRYAASQMPGLTRAFRGLGVEQARMSELATDRVKRLQTQYVSLGRDVQGMQKVMAITPKNLAKGYATDIAIAQQRQQLFNRALELGSTGMVNWGKNTQWAGRQLMVGFTIPLTIFAGVAAKTFKDLEAEAINFRKVYGDIFTTDAEVERNLKGIQDLSLEFTKYGIAVKDSMALANMAAQAGQRNADLIDATTQATRLSVLGQMESQEAMKTTISLQTAFGLSSNKLAEAIDFLNIVENQSVLSLDDVAGAIPRVAPVIQSLGGDVKDMAALLVAMKEGGVSAAEGANALKSSLGRLITPTKAAKDMAAGFGIDLEEMVTRNKGKVMPLIQELAGAMKMLDGLAQQQLLSQIFGKFQYARIGALFKSITDEASQANRVIKLMDMSTEELAKTAEKELAVIEESVSAKFTAAVEKLKVAIAPIGEIFLKALTPVINAVAKIAEAFNNLPDGVKTAIGVIVAAVGGLAPALLMGIGLIANGIGNAIKFILALRNGVKTLAGVLTGSANNFKHQSGAALDSAAAMASLEGRVTSLTGDLLMQTSAVNGLIGAYRGLAAAAGAAAASMPRGFGGAAGRGVRAPTVKVSGFNKGGVNIVPGTGNSDTIPAMLTPGESVMNQKATATYGPVLAAMNSGTLPGFNKGRIGQYTVPISGGKPIVFQGDQGQRMQAIVERLTKLLAKESQLSAVSRKELRDSVRRMVTESANGRVSIKRLVETVRQTVPTFSSRPIRTDVSSGATGAARNIQQRVSRTGLFSPEQEMLKRRFAGRLNPQQILSMGRVQSAHIEPRFLPGGKKDYGDLSNLRAEPAVVNNYLNRMKKSLVAIDDPLKQTISRQELAAQIQKRTNMSLSSVNKELDNLKAGIAPVTTEARRVARVFAVLDQKMSAQAASQGRGVSALGTQVATRYQPEAYRAVERSLIGRGAYAQGGVASSTYEDLRRRFNVAGAAPASTPQSGRAMAPFGGLAVAGQKVRSQILAQMGKSGSDAGAVFGKALTSSAAASSTPMPKAVLSATGHASAAAIFGVAGNQDGTLYGKSYVAAVRASLSGPAGRPPVVPQRTREILSALPGARTGTFIPPGGGQNVSFGNVGGPGGPRTPTITTSGGFSRQPEEPAPRGGRFSRFAGRMGGAAMGIGSVGMMASMIPMMMQDQEGKFMGMNANALSMGGMTASMLPGMLSMLGPKITLLVGAVAAAGVAFAVWRNNVDNASKAAAEFGSNVGGAANALTNMASMLGKSTPTQQLSRLQLGTTEEEAEAAFGEFQAMLSSEAGQAFLTKLENATSAERFSMLGDYIAAAIASGMMDSKTGQALAKTIAASMNDPVLGSAVSQAISKQETGVRAMIDLAEKRLSAVQETSPIKSLRGEGAGPARGTGLGRGGAIMGYEQASQAVGSSIQVIRDFAEAAAMAELEYKNGTISFSQYQDILRQTSQVQEQYGDYIRKSIQLSTDRGGTMQAAKSQLLAMGISEEQFGAVEDAAGDAPGVKELKEAGIATSEAMKASGYRLSDAIAALAAGMNPADVAAIMSFTSDLSTAAGQFYAQNMGQQGAIEKAGFIQATETGQIPGVDAEADRKRVIDVAINFTGNMADLQSFLASVPEEKVMKVVAQLESISPQQQREFINSFQRLSSEVGKDVASRITDSKQYQDALEKSRGKPLGPKGSRRGEADLSELKKIEKAVSDAQKAGVFGDLGAIIDFVLNEEPSDITTRLPELTSLAKDLNENVPSEVQKLLGIDINNPEDLDKYGPMAQELGDLVNVLENVPDSINKELAVSFMIDKNGKAATPEQFAKDINRILAIQKDFESGDIVLQKKAILELLQEFRGPDGSQLSEDQALNAFNDLVAKFGEQQLVQLPWDVIQQVIKVQTDVAGIEASIAALREAQKVGGEGFGARIAALEALKAAAERTQASLVAGGSIGSGGSRSGGGSGGSGSGSGGKKENPFKDLKKEILDQVKSFLDINANMNKLFSAKTKFFELLLRNNGVDDKINALNLSPGLAEQLKGMDPKDARKIIKKITNKKGELNQTGINLDRAAFAGQVGQRVSEAKDRIVATRQQGIAIQELRKRKAPVGAISAIAADPGTAAEYVRLLDEARKAEEKWKTAGKKGRSGAKKEWDRAKKAVDDYVKSLVNASRLEAGRSSQISAEEEKDVIKSQVRLGNIAKRGGASEEVLDEIRQNADLANEFFMLENTAAEAQRKYNQAVKEFGKNSKQAKAAQRELNAAKKAVVDFPKEIQTRINVRLQLLSPEEAIDKVYDDVQKGLTQNYDSQMLPLKQIEAEFEVAFNEIEDRYRGLIKASQDRAKALQKEVEGIQDQIYELQQLNEKDQFRIRALDRQKEMINRTIESLERANELDQRRIDALSRQSELIGREIEKLDRADELDQRRVDAIDRQNELLNRQVEIIDRADELDQRRMDALSRQTEMLNRQIEEVERRNELDQRNIDDIQRNDELRQRGAEALSKELEIMSRQEENINKQHEKQVKALEEVEKINEKISNQKKDQLNLAQALSQGDIFAAAQAAEQLKENQRKAAAEDRKQALEAAKDNAIASLRTSQGLTRDQAQKMITDIGDQSYQSSLAIRQIEDAIFERTKNTLSIKDEIYNIDREIRDIGDLIYDREGARLIILDQIRENDLAIRDINDQIYDRNLLRIPLLDRQYNIEKQIEAIQDAIYNRNLQIVPLRDQIYDLDLKIRDIADDIYNRETQILQLQIEKLAPLQRSLELENRKTQSLEEQMANEKAALEINGYTYEELKRQMDVLTDQYNLQIASLDVARENAKAVVRIKKNWDAVASAIAAANKTARKMSEIAFKAEKEAIEAEQRKAKEKADYDPTAAIAQIRKNREKEIERINAQRQREVEKAIEDAMKRQQSYAVARNAGGMIKKFAAAGMVSGDGSRDSVFAKLTPGEFVIRKAMVKKYGLPLMEDINSGAYGAPRYSISEFSSGVSGGKNKANISSPVYNTYSVNVNVPNAQVSADEVAHKVINKIKTIDSGSMRSYRGF